MSFDWLALESKMDGLQPPDRTAVLTVAGTWAHWSMGFPADVAKRLDDEKFYWQPVEYPASFGPVAGNGPSYADSVQVGRKEVTRLINLIPGKFALCGYSQGAEVTGWVCKDLVEGPLQHRLQDCIGSVTLGDPSRQKSDKVIGTGTKGWGISRLVVPAGVERVTFSLKGDMYSTVPDGQSGDNMYAVYQALTQLGSRPEALLGSILSGDDNLLEQLAEMIGKPLSGGVSLIISLVALAQFAATGAHTAYGPFVDQAASELERMQGES